MTNEGKAVDSSEDGTKSRNVVMVVDVFVVVVVLVVDVVVVLC